MPKIPMPLTRVLTVAIVSVTVLGVGLATPANADKRQRCLAAASSLLGHTVRGKDYRLVLGTAKSDRFVASARPDLMCGFKGNDRVRASGPPLKKGDIFVGGSGRDRVPRLKGGTFFGGGHDDTVVSLKRGTFVGSSGTDVVENMHAGTFLGGADFDWVTRLHGGTFDAGPGEDEVDRVFGGTFVGGPGADAVNTQRGGRFEGGEGEEILAVMRGGLFDGGPDHDLVWNYYAGLLIDIEKCRPAPELACP